MTKSAAIQELPDDPARLAALCSLWQSSESLIWITLQGGSMMPTFLPGCRLQVHCSRASLSVDDIVVFRDGSRLVAHRLVRIITDAGSQRRFLCLGDGNVFTDTPILEAAVLGIVIGSEPSPLWKRVLALLIHPRRHGRYALRRLRRAKPYPRLSERAGQASHNLS